MNNEVKRSFSFIVTRISNSYDINVYLYNKMNNLLMRKIVLNGSDEGEDTIK